MGFKTSTQRGHARTKELLATEANTILCYKAFIHIRAIAYASKSTSTHNQPSLSEDEAFEQIRLLADICHNLPPALRPSVAGGRKHRATAAMSSLWETSNPANRAWISETLADEGIRIEDVIEPSPQ
jgi:hypothetical protein